MARRWVGWSIGAIAVAISLCGLVGGVLCESAVRVQRRAVPAAPFVNNPEIRWRAVQITARDGAVLGAWLLWPENRNGNYVVVLHGIADSRASQMGLARLLLTNGYAVLAPDSRGQGESGGELVTYGLREADDVHRWVAWLEQSEHPRNVFGIGESLGAAILLQSLAVEHHFSAVVAECAFASFERIAEDRVAQRLPPALPGKRILAAPAVWAGFLYARLRYGVDFRAASPEAVLAKAATPVLLIHGLEDRNTLPFHSRILAATNPRFVKLWLVPRAGHTGAFGTAPVEFQKRVLGWFEAYQNLPPGIQSREI